MVAFVVSLLITGLMIAIIVRVAHRRAPGTPMTWGEAFVAGVFVFVLMFMAYGVVPHLWLAWADNELGWRSDKMVWENGISLGGRGRILISYQVVRDLIETVIYLVFLGGNFAGWLWWQRRGKKTGAQPEIETSTYGRPLVRSSS